MKRLWSIVRPRGWWGWIWRGMVGFAVFNLAAVEVTSQSWFCNSCHIMNSYYSSWKRGPHHEVECVRCHIPPGVTNYAFAKLNGAGQVVDDLLERTSSKPSANVADAACTRSGCHDLAKVRTISRKDGKFFFDHSKHLDLEYLGIKTHCTTCHSHIQGKEHFELNTNACVTCHLVKLPPPAPTAPATPVAAATTQPVTLAEIPAHEKAPPDKCASCHKPPDHPIEYQGLKVVHAEFVSYGASCESCHRGVTAAPQKINDDQCLSCHEFGIEKLGSVVETHRIHNEGKHKVECFSCHGVTRHGPSAQSMRLSQIDCQSCHQNQHAIQQRAYKSTDAPAHELAGASIVTPMFMAHVDCTGCHTKPRPLSMRAESGARVAVATPQSCDACHKPGLGETMVPMWQKNTHALYDSVAKLLPSQAPVSLQAQQLVNDARHLMETVKLDGSWGVHNPRYTQRLLEEAKQKLMEARELAPKKEGATP